MAAPIAQRLVDPPTGYIRPLNEVHTEYPKWVHFPDKRKLLVGSPEEEAQALAGEQIAPKPMESAPPSQILVGPNDEMEMLKKIAAEKGIRVDGRWSLKKLRSKVESASERTEQ